MSSVTQFPVFDGKVGLGPKASGHSVFVDGHLIPRLYAHDRGEEIEFILDGRFSYSVPTDMSLQFANAIATAMAIGAGWPHFSSKERAPFAPQVSEIKL